MKLEKVLFAMCPTTKHLEAWKLVKEDKYKCVCKTPNIKRRNKLVERYKGVN